MFSNIWQHCHVMNDHSKIWKMHFWMIQDAKKVSFDNFLDFGLLDRLDIPNSDTTKSISTFLQHYQVMKDDSKIMKMQFWKIQSAKKRVFCPFSGVKSVGSTWYCLHYWSYKSFDKLWYFCKVYDARKRFLSSTGDVNPSWSLCCILWEYWKVDQFQQDHWTSKFNRFTMQI